MTRFDLAREPRGQVLDGLIAAAVEACDRFTVELSGMVLSDRAGAVLRGFEPFLISREETSVTPGSILLPPDTVTLCSYRLDANSANLIRRAARRLYDWVEPDLPQDLSIMRGAQPWLVNLAADRAASLFLALGESEALRDAVPGLKIRPPDPRDTPRISRRVAGRMRKDFKPGDSDHALSLLGSVEAETDAGVERLQAAMLKLSGGNLEQLAGARALLEQDWRDLLVDAGFENDDWRDLVDEYLGPSVSASDIH